MLLMVRFLLHISFLLSCCEYPVTLLTVSLTDDSHVDLFSEETTRVAQVVMDPPSSELSMDLLKQAQISRLV